MFPISGKGERFGVPPPLDATDVENHFIITWDCNVINEIRIEMQYLQSGVAEQKIDDAEGFLATQKAMGQMGVSEKCQFEIFQLLCGILHLGLRRKSFLI